MTDSEYIQTILQLRSERDRHIIAEPRNWLSLCGLFWLTEGENPFGRTESNPVSLPAFPAEHCGVLRLDTGSVTLHTEAGNLIKVNGADPEARFLHTDRDPEPDVIQCGTVQMMVIERGGKLLLRTWDTASTVVKNFKGLRYFPVDETCRVTARYTPYDPPRTVRTFDAIGDEFDTEFCGQAEFTFNGKDCTLDAQMEENELLLNFTDLTREDATYPGGRHLTADLTVDGTVELDFNRAHNWPCAYTPYATCPVPPQQNRLAVRIEAGELKFH